ncbi:MAG: hypothetical protein H6619_07035 [Deltaproteobacteria bacterium]|nr:hypothetical protein [Deltaproteobacteria bacterium]
MSIRRPILFFSIIIFLSNPIFAQTREEALRIPDPTRTSESASISVDRLINESFGFEIEGTKYIAERYPQGTFGNESYSVPQAEVEFASGEYSLSGRDSKAGQYFFMSWNGTQGRTPKRMSIATFQHKSGQRYIVSKIGSSINVQRLTSPSIPNICGTSIPMIPNLPPARLSMSNVTIPTPIKPNEGETPVIDVMFAVTSDALEKAGGSLEMVAAIADFEIAMLNQRLEISGINAKIQRTCPVIELETTGSVTRAAVRRGDGKFDQLHLLRKECKADIVHIFRKKLGGYAYIPQTLSTTWQKWAFGESGINDLLDPSTTTFSHELAHNLGAGHFLNPDIDPSLSAGLFSDSHGSVFTGVSGTTYRSIMTYYNFNDNGPEYQGFSNPNIFYDGVKTGAPEFTNNAATINASAKTISEYSEHLDESSVDGQFIFQVKKEYGKVGYTLSAKFLSDGPPAQHEFITLWHKLGDSDPSELTSNLQVYSLPSDEVAEFEVGAIQGEVYAELIPSAYMQSEKISLPNFKWAQAKLETSGDMLTGQMRDYFGETIKINGPWLTLFNVSPEGVETDLGLINVNPDGSFSTQINLPGSYYVQWDYFDYLANELTIANSK